MNVPDDSIVVIKILAGEFDDEECIIEMASQTSGINDNRYYDVEYNKIYDDESLDEEEISDESRLELFGCIIINGISVEDKQNE
jgi:hypothetical protein